MLSDVSNLIISIFCTVYTLFKVEGRLKNISNIENGVEPADENGDGQDENDDNAEDAVAIWGVNSNDQIWFKSDSDFMWERIPGGLKQIEVGQLGVFGVNRNDAIYYRVGTNNNPQLETFKI